MSNNKLKFVTKMGSILTKYRSFWICLALTLATAAIFCQVRNYDFIDLDDLAYVYENPNIQAGITPKAIKWAYTTSHVDYWHPLTWLSHMLDWQLFGPNPAGHHLTNLILHIANTLLLFIVLKRMTHTPWPSAFVAALFALHPLHVESVAWVAERKDVLSTLFWLLTMAAYLRYVKHPGVARYLLTLLTFAMGLTAKPMLVTLPFVLLLLDYWPLARIPSRQNKKHTDIHSHRRILYHLIREKIPFFALSALSSVITFLGARSIGAVVAVTMVPLKLRVSNTLVSYVEYISKMFWPSRLAVLYPYPSQSVSILYAVISAAILLSITILILRFAKDHRYLITGWFWYLGTLVPVIGLVQVGEQALADRYTYITLTGLFIIIAWGLPDLLAKWRYKKIALALSALLIILAMSICTHFQLRYWRSDLTLFQHALDVTEDNYTAHYCVAKSLRKQGTLDKAIYHYSEVVRIKHDDLKALNGLGASLYEAGRIDEAIYYYKRALEIKPDTAEVHANLGLALAARGNFAEAVRHYRTATKTIDTPRIHSDFSYALLNLGQFQEAVKEYEKILSIQPQNVTAHNDLGVALFRQGKFDEAIAHFNQAIQIDPDYTSARNNLNIVLAEKQKLQNKAAENTKK